MRIFKTKKIMLAVLAAMAMMATLPVLQSCSNDDFLSTSQDIKLGVQRISINDVPKGIVPRVINSIEMENIKKEQSKLFVKKERVSQITKLATGKYQVTYNNKNKNTRLKAPGEYGSNTNEGFCYDIVVACSCPYVNSPNVMLTSRVTDFVGAYYDWNQRHVTARWGLDGSRWYLEYEITATVDQYVLFDGLYFLSRKEVYVQGLIYF